LLFIAIYCLLLFIAVYCCLFLFIAVYYLLLFIVVYCCLLLFIAYLLFIVIYYCWFLFIIVYFCLLLFIIYCCLLLFLLAGLLKPFKRRKLTQFVSFNVLKGIIRSDCDTAGGGWGCTQFSDQMIRRFELPSATPNDRRMSCNDWAPKHSMAHQLNEDLSESIFYTMIHLSERSLFFLRFPSLPSKDHCFLKVSQSSPERSLFFLRFPSLPRKVTVFLKVSQTSPERSLFFLRFPSLPPKDPSFS
jgi:hypothetical protein